MGRNAFETAVEVRGEGFRGLAGIGEWTRRIEESGQRFCALALELFLEEADEDERPGARVGGRVSVEGDIVEPEFEDEFAFADLPGEPRPQRSVFDSVRDAAVGLIGEIFFEGEEE